ncbi:putative amidohydrolase 2 [Treponema primitia ZAS-2]|uniref:Putative amidohydrolase 2 n=1 Tax=Treponema primitia (strain ATCC BAA-887 / DSM 12427 / ZAS-2) TaxID=545694 RepID=F5YK25_TREPZ|nr:amidohydrolase family protein [Treponema primitia]AEF86012.1 putative amidohydrolase 2 [Treponema primitia ZAS-2]
MLKIDAHSHAGEGAAVWSGKQVVERMDTIGIDKTIIFPFTEGFFNNQDIPRYVTEFPDRLIPFCAVNPWEKKRATDELERCLSSGFKGLKLHPTLCGFRLSDHALCDSLFEIVQAHKSVIIVHGASDLYNCPLEFDRMARRFPQVPLIMAHCGFFWEWELACELANENDNLYLETSRVPPFETGKVLEKTSASKMMWGTDGPFADYEAEYKKIERIVRNDTEFEQIIGGTVAGILGFK